jgi:hypothetical protein
MSRATMFLRLSLLLLAISFFALAVSSKLAWTVFWLTLIVHGAVVMVNMHAAQREWRKLTNRSWMAAVRAFPPWLIALGVAVVITAAAALPMSLGKTETGRPVTQIEVEQRYGRYFERLNADPWKEISRTEYEQRMRQVFQLFGIGWVVLSYCGLCYWQAVLHMQSEEAARSG